MNNIIQKFIDLGFKIDSTPSFSITLIRDNAKIYLTPNKAEIEFCEPNKKYYEGTRFKISNSMKPDELFILLKLGKQNVIKTTSLPF